MEVEFTTTNYKGKEQQETQRIAEFLYNEILFKERWNSISKEKIHLEEQPKVVCEAMGRMIERLLDKGVFNLEDLKYITQCNWGRTSDSLKLKKEEENA